MKERNGSDVRFGLGKWQVNRTVVDQRAIYGVCANSPHMSDSICICPAPDAERFGAIHLVIRRQEHSKIPPSVVDRLEYSIGDGSWSEDTNDDVPFEDVFVMPLSRSIVVYMVQGPDFEDALRSGIKKIGRNAQMHIGVLRHYKAAYDDQSASASFDLDGFEQAWRALRVFREGSYEMLLEPSDV